MLKITDKLLKKGVSLMLKKIIALFKCQTAAKPAVINIAPAVPCYQPELPFADWTIIFCNKNGLRQYFLFAAALFIWLACRGDQSCTFMITTLFQALSLYSISHIPALPVTLQLLPPDCRKYQNCWSFRICVESGCPNWILQSYSLRAGWQREIPVQKTLPSDMSWDWS